MSPTSLSQPKCPKKGSSIDTSISGVGTRWQTPANLKTSSDMHLMAVLLLSIRSKVPAQIWAPGVSLGIGQRKQPESLRAEKVLKEVAGQEGPVSLYNPYIPNNLLCKMAKQPVSDAMCCRHVTSSPPTWENPRAQDAQESLTRLLQRLGLPEYLGLLVREFGMGVHRILRCRHDEIKL